MGVIMPAIFELLYREYCRARLAEMRKQLLIAAERAEAIAADYHPATQVDDETTDAYSKSGHGLPN
ncbi:hypothetical protein AB7M16_002883 [Bradyrhizobium sp. USDA 372]|nr:hypothetical protein [Bradyrhizobium sp. WBAH30]MDD1545084.1 hypothetical protein [Bradyrhizobium sp. WBAH41]MDD1558513.1 hypothetical protein [Bradyrhizobium sp. WBAH23]MDD1565911.1 hypothetical protein [Bradyrhizobium sp. WBAH33]MDD1591291.1 hypothetical protein [Bradyrhizobium sp. WBAH42]NRB89589.1 hypothetical protein [Bradyrhizobium sp. WBAH10]QCJ88714.1 hypothetical protein DAA57_09500 [Bradyrhizobium yuanmingense]